MKTGYVLMALVTFLAMMAIFLSQIMPVIKCLLLLLVVGLVWREVRSSKAFINEHNMLHEAIITRYLCFVRVKDGDNSQYLPISRLDLSKESFRRLKSVLNARK